MKPVKSIFFTMAFACIALLHFFLFRDVFQTHETAFFKYYLFQALLFMMVVTILLVVKKIYPNYVGFGFLGLVFFKLTLMLLLQKKISFGEIAHGTLHFVVPYLLILVLETAFAVNLLSGTAKDEKNQQS